LKNLPTNEYSIPFEMTRGIFGSPDEKQI